MSSLQAFIQKLQETDEEVVFSEKPKKPIKVIPPSTTTTNISLKDDTKNIKIVPPKSEPKVLQFKLKMINTEKNSTTKTINVNNDTVISKPKAEKVESISKEDLVNILFKKSGTGKSKYNIWLDYYKKAQTSKKKNSVVERVKQGKFVITSDNKLLVLPDYDVFSKDTRAILQDKWLKN